jgi:hypothetical protein
VVSEARYLLWLVVVVHLAVMFLLLAALEVPSLAVRCRLPAVLRSAPVVRLLFLLPVQAQEEKAVRFLSAQACPTVADQGPYGWKPELRSLRVAKQAVSTLVLARPEVAAAEISQSQLEVPLRQVAPVAPCWSAAEEVAAQTAVLAVPSSWSAVPVHPPPVVMCRCAVAAATVARAAQSVLALQM